MKTLSFYSYKGGVGRTMAVSNFGYYLSRLQKTIFFMDFDFEAPGLHYKLETYNKPIDLNKGLIDFVYYFQENEDFPEDWESYIRKLECKERGMKEMWFMPAGNPWEKSYWRKLAAIDWKKLLYEEGSWGTTMFLELQARIAATYDPDFLLIDSRTGLTDISSVTLNLLADDVFVLGANNQENLDGSRLVMEKLRAADALEFKEKPKLHFILTRIPVAEQPSEKRREEEIVASALETLNIGSGIQSGKLVEQVHVVHADPEFSINEGKRLGEIWKKKTPFFWDNYGILQNYRKKTLGEDVSDFEELSSRLNQVMNESEFDEVANLIELNFPTFVDPFLDLGYRAANLGFFEKSIKYLTLAIENAPDFAPSYYNRGCAYIELKQYEAASKDFDKAINLNPKYVDAYYNRGSLSKNQGKFESAIADYSTVIALDPNGLDAYSKRSIIFVRIGKFEEALADIEKFVKLSPTDATAHGTLAEIHSALGNTDLFYESLQKALELDPTQINELDESTKFRHQHEERFQAFLKKYRS